jgi:transcriptional regulator with XRE-family HTH domain
LNLDYSIHFSHRFVARLRAAREAKGFTQTKLAKLAGISRSALSMIESEDRNPTLFVCHALAKALGLQLSAMMRGVEIEEKKHPKKFLR